jgi:hypothetical protein
MCAYFMNNSRIDLAAHETGGAFANFPATPYAVAAIGGEGSHV